MFVRFLRTLAFLITLKYPMHSNLDPSLLPNTSNSLSTVLNSDSNLARLNAVTGDPVSEYFHLTCCLCE